jgi:hypothetical protein
MIPGSDTHRRFDVWSIDFLSLSFLSPACFFIPYEKYTLPLCTKQFNWKVSWLKIKIRLHTMKARENHIHSMPTYTSSSIMFRMRFK